MVTLAESLQGPFSIPCFSGCTYLSTQTIQQKIYLLARGLHISGVGRVQEKNVISLNDDLIIFDERSRKYEHR